MTWAEGDSHASEATERVQLYVMLTTWIPIKKQHPVNTMLVPEAGKALLQMVRHVCRQQMVKLPSLTSRMTYTE